MGNGSKRGALNGDQTSIVGSVNGEFSGRQIPIRRQQAIVGRLFTPADVKILIEMIGARAIYQLLFQSLVEYAFQRAALHIEDHPVKVVFQDGRRLNCRRRSGLRGRSANRVAFVT